MGLFHRKLYFKKATFNYGSFLINNPFTYGILILLSVAAVLLFAILFHKPIDCESLYSKLLKKNRVTNKITQISLNKPSSVVEQKILNKNEGVSVLSLLSEKEKNENFQ